MKDMVYMNTDRSAFYNVCLSGLMMNAIVVVVYETQLRI